MTQTLNVEYRKVETLIPFARNPRTHSEAQIAKLAASIVEFGWTNPVLVDGSHGIIAGHGRVMGARAIGLAEVPCIRLAHLTESQRRAYVIADNKLALNAGWDDAMLALEMRDLMAEGYDVGLTGFELGDIDDILRETEILGMPALPSGEKSQFQQVTFTLHDSQSDELQRALKAAKAVGPFVDSPNANSNGNALARICETFLAHHGDR